jgi:hypothetical protein
MMNIHKATLSLLIPASLVCLIVALSFSTEGTKAQSLRPLEQALNAAGYQLYNPPRANWGPGFVFAGDIVQGRITNVREICPNLYGDTEAPQSADILLPNYSARDKISFSATLRFLKSVFGLNFDLDKVEQEHSVEVKWQNIRESSYTEMDKWLADGKIKPIPIQCRRAIESLQGRNAFADRVFVIVRAVAPESLIYDFSSAANGQGSASAALLTEAQAKVQGSGANTAATQLEIRKRLYVGYAAPVKLSEWTDPGLSSGELVKVKGQSTDLRIAAE